MYKKNIFKSCLILCLALSTTQLIHPVFGNTPKGESIFKKNIKIADITVKGRVTDDKGENLVGVNITVKGTNQGAITDLDGRYSVVAPENGTLVFSFVGYETKEVAINGRTVIDIQIDADQKTLGEYVVVGYGTQKRASVTGAISSVSSKEISQLAAIDVNQAIQGRVPGVSVVANGAPGESPIVRIRGIGSINYASNPLYVIDGFPTGDLNSLDTRDIESVEVLKDASATTIYGSRAANGVIMITTKKAKNDGGKIHLGYDAYYGVQSAWRKLDLLTRDEYIKYGTALRTNAGQALPARFTKLNEPIYPGATQTYAQTETDWQNEVFRSAPITQHNVSISNGGDKSRFFASFGYMNQEGIMIGTGYDRFNARFNSDHTLGSRVTFGQNLSISYDSKLEEANGGGRTQIKHIIANVPYIPVLDPTLKGGYRGPDGADGSDPQNPVRIALQDVSRSNRLKLLGNAFVNVKLLDWLSYRFNIGIDYVAGTNRNNSPIYNESFNARSLNRVEKNTYTYTSPLFTNQLTFEKAFGQHTIKAIAVIERQDGIYRFLNGGGSYSTNDLTEVTNAAQDPSVNGGLSESVLLSYLGRLNYEFGGKYLFEASIRRDGSSIFAPGKKWGNFPSFSVGWRLSEEDFIKQVPAISELKLRASYGSMGFNGINNYAWQPVISQNTAPIFAGDTRVQGAYFDFLGNTDLEWEITKMTNIGVDLGLFNNRVTFQAEYYTRQTDGLILSQPLSPSLGFSQSTPANVGSMSNKGVELQLSYNSPSNKDFIWKVGANIGFVKNKVLSFGENIKSPIFAGENSDYGGSPFTKTTPDEAVQGFYGWVVDGIIQNKAELDALNSKKDKDGKTVYYQNEKTAPGDIKFKDLNGDGVIDGEDRQVLGSFIPDFTYGASFDATYKGFDFSLFLQGTQGNSIYNGTKVLRQGMLRLFGAGKEVLNAWTPTNTNTDVPRAIDGDPNQNSRTSSRFIEDGSYLRVKNLSIGYNVPSSILQNATKGVFSRARIYLSAQNIITITKYTGYDPEIGSRFGSSLTNGVDYGQFPASRVLMVGLQVGF
jgi:TonB-dependent starch-binding outer membrane protein SusC